MARQADDPDVVAEILAAELGADPHIAGEFEDLLLHLQVAEGVRLLRAPRRQAVEIARAGELDRLQVELGRHAADADGEVIRRARRGADCTDLLVEEGQHRLGVEPRRGLLEQEGLVGRAAALGDEQEPVLAALAGVDLDLRRQIGPGVHLLVHGDRREVGIAQIALGVGLVDAGGERRGVAAPGPHTLALLAHDDRGAGVLAHRQHPAGGDIGVLQQVVGDEPVVVRGFLVVEDGGELGEMARPQEMRDVEECPLREKAERLRLHRQHVLATEPLDADMVRRELAIGGRVVRERELRVVGEFRHVIVSLRGRLPEHRIAAAADQPARRISPRSGSPRRTGESYRFRLMFHVKHRSTSLTYSSDENFCLTRDGF